MISYPPDVVVVVIIFVVVTAFYTLSFRSCYCWTTLFYLLTGLDEIDYRPSRVLSVLAPSHRFPPTLNPSLLPPHCSPLELPLQPSLYLYLLLIPIPYWVDDFWVMWLGSLQSGPKWQIIVVDNSAIAISALKEIVLLIFIEIRFILIRFYLVF